MFIFKERNENRRRNKNENMSILQFKIHNGLVQWAHITKLCMRYSQFVIVNAMNALHTIHTCLANLRLLLFECTTQPFVSMKIRLNCSSQSFIYTRNGKSTKLTRKIILLENEVGSTLLQYKAK